MIRRKGVDWYYGAITNASARKLELKLDFLPRGRYEATIYADTPETEKDARKISIETKTVSAGDTLTIDMVREGGQAIVFKKAESSRAFRRPLQNGLRPQLLRSRIRGN